MKAGEILTEAAKIVEGSRQQTHGEKERSFETIASFWNVYLDARSDEVRVKWALDGVDVANMMALLKLARSIVGDDAQVDHYVDQAGYAGLAGELATSK